MAKTEEIDAAIEALQSAKLYCRYYASTKKTADHVIEMATMLESGHGASQFLKAFAEALRKL